MAGWVIVVVVVGSAAAGLRAARWLERGGWRRPGEQAALPRLPSVRVLLAGLMGAAGALVGWGLLRPGWWPAGLAGLVFVLAAAPGAVVDLAVHRVPEPLVLTMQAGVVALLLTGALVTGDWGSLGRAVAAGVTAWLAVFGLALVTGLGFADVQLFGTAALCLGWVGWLPAVWVVGAGFVVGGLCAAVMRAAGRSGPVPMAPSIGLGFLLTVATLPAAISTPDLAGGLAALLASGPAAGRG
ncbi:hypothetical protein [Intrasporangium sp.]|uniref:hypothetical protein n=1 Tax=Intrasporangium sp. TaxID=1925024 RepID=UPI003221993F